MTESLNLAQIKCLKTHLVTVKKEGVVEHPPSQESLTTGKKTALNDNLRANIDYLKTLVERDFDAVSIVDGEEGSGKSTLAQIIGGYLDPTLNLDRICFTPEEFRNAILAAKKGQVVIYDEAYFGLSSRGAMTNENRNIVSLLTQIRQMNLYVFICMPTIFMADHYISLWRSRFLLHVYTAAGQKRGYFAFYSRRRKKKLYLTCKKSMDYQVRPNFIGRWGGNYFVDEKLYREKKLRSLGVKLPEVEPLPVMDISRFAYDKSEIKPYVDEDEVLAMRLLHGQINVSQQVHR